MTAPVVLRAPDLDWVKFDAELARDGSVEPVEKALYAALASFADTAERSTAEDPDDEDVPTRKRLAECIGRSVDTTDRAIKKLEEYGLLEVERRKDPTNPRSNIPSIYRLLDRERWDERAGERAAKRRAERERQRAAKEAKERAEREAAERVAEKQQADGLDSPSNDQEEGWPHTCGQGGRTHAARVAAHMRPGWPHTCGGTSSLREESSSSEGCGENTIQEPTPNHGDQSEEEESHSAEKKPRGVRPVDLIQDLTDATDDDAQALWESIRPNVRTSPGGLIRHMANNGDLDYRLGEIRAQRASESRTEANQAGMGGNCTIHSGQEMPCLPCKSDLAAGGEEADRVIELYLSDPDARPDLTDNRHLIRRLNERQPAGGL